MPYQPGTLEAVAGYQGKEIRDERRTAGAPHHLALEADTRELESGNLESLAYITARVVDENGAVVPTAEVPITFTSSGPGELLPPPFRLAARAVRRPTDCAGRETWGYL